MFSDDRMRQMLSSVAADPTPSPEFVDRLWDVLARERAAPAARWRTVALPLAATLAALLVLLLALLVLSGHPSPPILGGIVGTIEVDGASKTLLAEGDTVIFGWPANLGRLDTAATGPPPTTSAYTDVAVGPAGWWVAGPEHVQRWMPSGSHGWGPAAGTIIDVHAIELAVGRTEIVVRTNPRDLIVFDVATGAQNAAFERWGAHDLAVGGGALWFRSDRGRGLHRLDLASGRESSPPIPFDVQAKYAIGAGDVWVADTGSRRVFRLDPATAEIRAVVDVGLAPIGIALDPDGYVWVAGWAADAGAGVQLCWIDPATNASHVGPIDVADAIGVTGPTRPWDGEVFGLAVTRDAAWVGLARTSVDGTDPGTINGMTYTSTIVRVAIERPAD